jgi:hypothetical protein
MKDWFKFRTAWLQAIGMFEHEAIGRLFLAVITYAATGEEPALSGPEMAVFTVIAQVLREDAELSAMKSAAGAQGGRPKKKRSEKKQCFSEEYDSEKQCFLNEKQCFSEENGGKKQCFFTPPEAPEGPRIKALDSMPAATEEKEDAEAPTDTHIDTSIDTNNTNNYRENRNDSKKRFAVPTVEEVDAYCRERGNNVDAQRFVDFYASKGWRIGKEPMRDWRACVRTWERNGRDRVDVSGSGPVRPAKTVAAQQYSQRDYSDEDEEALARMLATAREQGF